MGDWYNPLSWDMVNNANVPTTYTDRNQLLGYVNQGMGPGGIANQQAPQMQAAQLQQGEDPFRQAQLQQMGQLQGIASGQQQGAGELAAQRQIQQALAAQQAQARMARGGNAALAYRNAANQSAALGSTGAGMGQQAALQDQQAAQGQLAGLGQAGRAGDFSTANANAGYQQGANQNNAGFQQNAQQNSANNYLQLMNQLGTMNANELGAANATSREGNKNQTSLLGGLLSQAGQGASTAAMMSDERLKTDVIDAGAQIDKMLDGLHAKAGRYKDEKHGKGEWNWIMAQDMERSQAGKRVVFEAPDGSKMLDVNKAVSTSLAAAARLNERLRKLEASRR